MSNDRDPAEAVSRELQSQAIARAILDLLGDRREWVGTGYALRRVLGISDKRFLGAAGMKAFADEFASGRVAEILLEHGVEARPQAFNRRNAGKAEALFSRATAVRPQRRSGKRRKPSATKP